MAASPRRHGRRGRREYRRRRRSERQEDECRRSPPRRSLSESPRPSGAVDKERMRRRSRSAENMGGSRHKRWESPDRRAQGDDRQYRSGWDRQRRSRSRSRSRSRQRDHRRGGRRSYDRKEHHVNDAGRHGKQQKTRRKKMSIPDNWADVPKMGALIAASRFVAMRVPLDDKYAHLVATDEVWTPATFLQEQAAHGHDVRMVIDLTNTTKYYDGEKEFQDTPLVKYVKLRIEGFKSPPRESEVEKFLQIVDEFIAQEASGTIAVHCTHGLNRTGYLIVSYLVRRCGVAVQDALAAFSVARPPGLIKHMYIEDLFRRFAPQDPVVLPELPEWAATKYAGRRV